MINLVLLFGGKSVEHDISVITYKQVVSAVDLKKYNVLSVYLDKNNDFYLLKVMLMAVQLMLLVKEMEYIFIE